jgi:hypothetical protein
MKDFLFRVASAAMFATTLLLAWCTLCMCGYAFVTLNAQHPIEFGLASFVAWQVVVIDFWRRW